MSDTQNSSSHGKLIVAVVAAALVIVLALVSAFIWPGWALNKDSASRQTAQGTSQGASKTTESSKPTINATPLPDDASELLKAMPDSVLNFARTKASASASWSAASPVEEYTLTYSTGKSDQDVTLVVAQWSEKDDAKDQYDSLTGDMSGKELGSGNVKVSGTATGAYTVKTDSDDENKAIAVWQNDTVVFQATGAKESVQRFYQQFPL